MQLNIMINNQDPHQTSQHRIAENERQNRNAAQPTNLMRDRPQVLIRPPFYLPLPLSTYNESRIGRRATCASSVTAAGVETARRPPLVENGAKVCMFISVWIIGIVSLGASYITTLTLSNSASTIYLAALVLHSGTGLAYLLINIATAIVRPQNPNLSCVFIFLYAPNKDSRHCCVGFCIAFWVGLPFFLALFSFIKAICERYSSRALGINQRNEAPENIYHA